MYVATQHTFFELPKVVQPVRGGLTYDPALQVWSRPRETDGSPPLPLCFPGDEGIIASIIAERKRTQPKPSQLASTIAPQPSGPVPLSLPGGGQAVPLTPNCFAFLRNNKWSPEAVPSTVNPQYWVVRVVAVGPGPPGAGSALARVQWFQETDLGTGMYRQTPRVVSELVRSLRHLNLVPDAAAKAFKLVGGFDESVRFLEPRSGGPAG